MMQTVAERYQKPLPVEIVSKLEVSRRQAERLVKREIKCPNCGFHLLEVYGTDHHITRVKCQKCKFNELIDTAMFRTIKKRGAYRITSRSRKNPLR